VYVSGLLVAVPTGGVVPFIKIHCQSQLHHISASTSTSISTSHQLRSSNSFISIMGWPSREETIRQMGLDDTQWQEASELQDLLSTLADQRGLNPDAKDMKGRLNGYLFASRSMFHFTFHTVKEPYYDRRRKCLWYLGWRVCSLSIAVSL
jgi:hypothetical protein